MGGDGIYEKNGEYIFIHELNNFEVFPFLFNGKRYHSAESAYQSCKWIEVDTERYEKLVDCVDPKLAWTIGQEKMGAKHSRLWEKQKVEYMLQVNRAKLLSSQHHQDILASTEDRILFFPESSHFWGTDGEMKWSFESPQKNWNGLIFMYLREELKDDEHKNKQLILEIEKKMKKRQK
jgi:ribA/ribD-fused uncharacterized protein